MREREHECVSQIGDKSDRNVNKILWKRPGERLLRSFSGTNLRLSTARTTRTGSKNCPATLLTSILTIGAMYIIVDNAPVGINVLTLFARNSILCKHR